MLGGVEVSVVRLVAAVPLLALTSLTLVSPAQAAPPSTATYLYSTPDSGPLCSGTHEEQCTLGNDMVRRLNAVPRGGRIDVVLYSSWRRSMADALVAAARRGVTVRLLTSHPKPDGEESADVSSNVTALVTKLRAAGGTAVVGWGSLSRGGKHGKSYAKGRDDSGLEHRKLVLIDPDGKLNGNELTISDSGNWTYALDSAYNDRMVVRDSCMYAGALKHLNVLAQDRSAPKMGAVSTCDGKRKLWFLPEVHVDPVRAWADHARCGKGATVTFSNFYLTAGSKSTKEGGGSRLVDNLIRFRKAGARVEVGANDAKWSKSLRARLVKAGVEVYDVDVSHDQYDHQKAFAATGCQGGSFLAQGSTTMNATAYRSNGNAILTSTVWADAHAEQVGFGTMVRGKHRFND